MPSIDSSSFPLAFPAAAPATRYDGPPGEPGRVTIRTLATALTGMQKEALVLNGATGGAWRLVSDEGPYLNGTDLAPFPLSFFAVGMAYDFVHAIHTLAGARDIAIDALSLTQDNRYTMEGSALKGTMVGGALPVELTAHVDSPADDDALGRLVTDAVAAAPIGGLLREPLTSRFTLTRNGEPAPLGRVRAIDGAAAADPRPVLDALRPSPNADFPDDIIVKARTAEETAGEGGAGSSLKAEQKRVLHMRTATRTRNDGLVEATVQLFNPVGSWFRFLGDVEGTGRAPQGLDYASAGIAFCYLTQMGRFAHIAKLSLAAYRIVQDTAFAAPGAAGTGAAAPPARPVETHVHVDSSEALAEVQRVADMSEQTCFLHAACRTPLSVEAGVEHPSRPELQ